MASLPEPNWPSAVTVRLREDLRATWKAGLGRTPEPRTVRVTELVDLRPAFYRRRSPVPPSPEQRARLEEGQDLHAQLEAALAAGPENQEVRLRKEGIVGQIDLFDQIPIELKTSSTLPEAATLAAARPQYLEQLAMYCALAGVPKGRLLLVRSDSGVAVDGAAIDVDFAALPPIWSEMHRRADLLRQAESDSRASGLPRCSWFEWGCEFRAAHVCDCSGQEPPTLDLSPQSPAKVSLNPEATARLLEQIRGLSPVAAPLVRRFGQLLFPRRTYFEQVDPAPSPPTPDSGGIRSTARDSLYRRIVEGLESGPPGSVTRRPAQSGPVPESVSCWNGAPYLVKVTASTQRPSAPALLAGQPHYFVELGLRCAAVGAPHGWLLLGQERAAAPEEAIWPFQVDFDPLPTLAELARVRAENLRIAIETHDPSALPACPAWMSRTCAYRGHCGCGAPAENR